MEGEWKPKIEIYVLRLGIKHGGEVYTMKAVILTIVASYVFIFWLAPMVYNFIFPWGGVAETHLHPIYFGIIFLSGLIMGCTLYLGSKIAALKKGE